MNIEEKCIIGIDGRKIDLDKIENPKLKRVFERRVENNSKPYKDYSDDYSDYRDYCDHIDYRDHSDSAGGGDSLVG